MSKLTGRLPSTRNCACCREIPITRANSDVLICFSLSRFQRRIRASSFRGTTKIPSFSLGKDGIGTGLPCLRKVSSTNSSAFSAKISSALSAGPVKHRHIRAPQSRGSAYFDICFVYGNRELVTTDCRIRSTESKILLPKFFSDSAVSFSPMMQLIWLR